MIFITHFNLNFFSNVFNHLKMTHLHVLKLNSNPVVHSSSWIHSHEQVFGFHLFVSSVHLSWSSKLLQTHWHSLSLYTCKGVQSWKNKWLLPLSYFYHFYENTLVLLWYNRIYIYCVALRSRFSLLLLWMFRYILKWLPMNRET